MEIGIPQKIRVAKVERKKHALFGVLCGEKNLRCFPHLVLAYKL